MAETPPSLPTCEGKGRRRFEKELPGNEIDERMVKECTSKDGKRGCYPGEIHCAPGLGGGCCPSNYPVCCGTGRHCRKHGPC